MPRPFLLCLAACACGPIPTDAEPDVQPACDADGRHLATADGRVDCAETLQVCDAASAACVDPWRWSSPTFEACDDHPDATVPTLTTKAAVYQERADNLHVHPDLGWMLGVTLEDGADPATATFDDVASWQRGANDGLWSSLYLASQAFRYAATEGEARAAALDNLRLLLHAEVERMDVSGMPGNFVRTYVKPGVDGLDCPAGDDAYRADVEKDDDRWVKLDDDGCITWLPTTGDTWVVSDVCPGPDFAGWCFLDNTSKDEYAGHMFALGAVLKLVDDPEAVALADGLVLRVVEALLAQDLYLYDPDGRITEHGDFSPAAGLGFNAAFTLAFFTMASERFDDPAIDTAKACFVGHTTEGCPVFEPSVSMPFHDTLHLNAVHLDEDGCLSNDNNASMFLLSMVDLLWWERDPDLRATYQAVLQDVFESPTRRALGKRENAWYNIAWGAFKALGDGRGEPAIDLVNEAVCGLTVFPEDQVRRAVPPSDAEQLCLDRLDRPMGANPRGPHERCLESFVWWKDQYVLRGCDAIPNRVEPPADYLLPYWMGRYFGFIDPAW